MRHLAATFAAVLTLGGTACADRPPAALPPPDLAALAPVLDPLVRPLDLRVARAALVDRDGGPPNPEARHLAVYVEPTVGFSDERFVQTILPLARAVTPFVFERWPGLESYDICQEPSPGVDDRPEPETQTVFDVSRSYADATDWATVGLPELVQHSRDRRPGIVVAVTSRLLGPLDAAVRR